MKKRYLAIVLVIAFTFAVVLGSCGGGNNNAPAPAPAPAPAAPAPAAPAPAAPAAEPLELKYNNWTPANQSICAIEEEAAQMIYDQTDGRIQITCYFSESLLSQPDSYTGLAEGVADISCYMMGITPGIHELNNIFNTAITGLPDAVSTMKIYQEMIDTMPEFQEEMAQTNTRWLAIRTEPATQIHSIKKGIRVPDDAKGMKIISSGDAGRIAEAVGGASTPMGPADFYTSLERGVAEAQFSNWASNWAFRTIELFKFHTFVGDGGLGLRANGFLINLDTWNKISPEDQKIIEDAYRWCAEQEAWDNEAKLTNAYKEAEGEHGAELIYLTPDEIALWEAVADPLAQEWIEKTAAKGWPAQQAYDLMKQLAAKY